MSDPNDTVNELKEIKQDIEDIEKAVNEDIEDATKIMLGVLPTVQDKMDEVSGKIDSIDDIINDIRDDIKDAGKLIDRIFIFMAFILILIGFAALLFSTMYVCDDGLKILLLIFFLICIALAVYMLVI